MKHLSAGEDAQAMEALDASIAAEPMVWAYRERAKLHGNKGDDQAALADCDAALKIAPDDQDIRWLQGEFAKPAAQRFQGKFKNPPSANR